ncbi:MAG: hypothetical protein ACJAQT_001334 [Akkermansiaceae bacterium]|jgi:hypothetical protein
MSGFISLVGCGISYGESLTKGKAGSQLSKQTKQNTSGPLQSNDSDTLHSSSNAQVHPSGPEPVVRKTRNPTILFLGDSMSMGAFGRTLDQELRESGFKVYTFATGGATPYYWLSDYQSISSTVGHWMRTPTIERRLKTIKRVPKVEPLIESCDPDIVIIQTGTNMYATLRSKRRSQEANTKEVASVYKKMFERVTAGGRKCYWITPPSAHQKRYPRELQNRMLNLIQDTVKPSGRVFDSYKITKYTDPFPKTDGIHYGPTKARAWAELVAKDFIHYARQDGGVGHNIKSSQPESGDKNQPSALAVNLELTVRIPTEQSKADSSKPQADVDASLGNKIPEDNYDNIKPPGNEDFVADIKLIHKSSIGALNEVVYSRAWSICEYEVITVRSGYYPYRKLRLAEFVVNNRKIAKTVRDRRIGEVRYLKLEPMSNYPSLERLQTIDNLELNLNLPIFIPSMK